MINFRSSPGGSKKTIPSTKTCLSIIITQPQKVVQKSLESEFPGFAKNPVIVKLSPNVPNIVTIAESAVAAGANALTVCNTMPAMKIDIKTHKPVLGNVLGGLSGISLKPIAIALIHQIKSCMNVPIIGVGGVFSAEDIMEYLLVGASAIQIGSANLISPQAPMKLQDDLVNFMKENNFESLRDIKTFNISD